MTQQNGLIDILRLMGALGIVWFHTVTHGHTLAYAALPMFIALAIILQPRQANFGAFLRKRARRLLWPWGVWSAIYGCFLVASAWHHGLALTAGFRWNMLLMGTVLPLWFLPFLFVSGLLVNLAEARLGRNGLSRTIGFLILVLVMPVLILMLPQQTLPAPLQQWRFGVVPVVYGLAARLSAGSPLRMGLVFAALSLSALGADLLPASWSDVFAIWLGTGLALICSMIRLPARPWTAAFGPISFLIYLVHPGAILLVHSIAGGLDQLWSALLVIGISLGFALMAVRWGWDRVLL